MGGQPSTERVDVLVPGLSVTQQVEALIFWAHQEAGNTGHRIRIRANRAPNTSWWYQAERLTATVDPWRKRGSR